MSIFETDYEARMRDQDFERSGRIVRHEPPKPYAHLEPKREHTACCDGTGMEDDSVRCTVCRECPYCGARAAVLDGRDEDGDPVHVVCAPGGAFRVAVEACWAARKGAAALVGPGGEGA